MPTQSRPSTSPRSVASSLVSVALTYRSTSTLSVINLYVGTSFISLSYVALSIDTALFALSLTFPLDHFFFLALPPLPEEGLEGLADLESFLGAWNEVREALVGLKRQRDSRVGPREE
jgi:hypothetical protein